MALVLEGYCRMGVEYQGRSHHIDQLISYLRRTTRLKYRQVDIERVCELLTYFSDKDARKLLAKLTAHGLKLHPRSAQLSLQAGVMALGNSKPPFLDPAAVRHLEQALALAEESKLPSETALLPVIRKMLTTIKEMSHMAERSLFVGGPFADADFDEWDEDSWDDDDDLDDDFQPAASPKKKTKAKSRKR